MNTKDIADAIAARFTGVTATVGGATESIVVGPTASLPNTLSKGPALLVFPPTGALDIALSRRRADVLTFPVRFLRDPMDYPARCDALYAWYDALRDEVEKDIDLGLTYVAWAQPSEVEVELDGFNYAGVLFDRIEFTVTVRLDEVVTTIA